jgi:hypothetical protein
MKNYFTFIVLLFFLNAFAFLVLFTTLSKLWRVCSLIVLFHIFNYMMYVGCVCQVHSSPTTYFPMSYEPTKVTNDKMVKYVMALKNRMY